jgi:hypothetical protein
MLSKNYLENFYFLIENLKKHVKFARDKLYLVISEELNEEEYLNTLSELEEIFKNITEKLYLLNNFFKFLKEKGTRFKGNSLDYLFFQTYFLIEKEERKFLIKRKQTIDLINYINKFIQLANNFLVRINLFLERSEVSTNILRKYFSIMSNETTHLEIIMEKTKNLLNSYSTIALDKLIFNELALKRIKKERNWNSLKLILYDLKVLIKEGLKGSNQLRIMPNGFIDYLERHKKERIILRKINNKELIVYDILFDHLGKDKKDYNKYWEGSVKINNNNVLVLTKPLLSFIIVDTENRIVKILYEFL